MHGGAGIGRRAVDLAHASLAGDDVGLAALSLLDEYVGARFLVSTTVAVDGRDVRPPTALGEPPPLTPDEYAAWVRLLPTHPYARHLATATPASSRLTDEVDLAAFTRSELFCELLAPHGARFQAAAVLDVVDGQVTLLSLYRHDRDFDDRELERIELVRRPLAAALQLRAARAWALADEDSGAADAGAIERLTPRQREVVALVADGLTNRQIGRRLAISERTARKHLEDAARTLGATSRTQVAAAWLRRR